MLYLDAYDFNCLPFKNHLLLAYTGMWLRKRTIKKSFEIEFTDRSKTWNAKGFS